MTWPDWQPEIVSVEDRGRLAPGEVARGAADLLGFKVHGHSTATEVAARCFEEDVVVGVRMKICYEVEPRGAGSLVTHSLVADLPGGTCGGVLALVLRWRLRRLQRTALAGLTRQSEAISPR
jgi:Polyketide cyclase / dehydrase and lipid transport